MPARRGQEVTMSPPNGAKSRTNLRWSAWNLLLLVPFLMLLTPLYNSTEPRLLGLPYFYWLQFAFVPVAVICVVIVYVKTKDGAPRPDDRAEPSDGSAQ
jgi:hypothetical protein